MASSEVCVGKEILDKLKNQAACFVFYLGNTKDSHTPSKILERIKKSHGCPV